MGLRSMFTRGPERSILTLVRTASGRWVLVTRTSTQLRVVSFPDLISAVLLQLERERELVSAGWHLTAVQKVGSHRRALDGAPQFQDF